LTLTRRARTAALLSALTLALAGLVVAALARLDEARPTLPAGALVDRVIVEKAAHRLTLIAAGRPMRSYDVALGRGGLEPKRREGDNRTPEGVYRIVGRDAGGAFRRALRISYPDAVDRSAAKRRGESAGGDVLIHGLPAGLGWLGRLHRRYDWTAGCIAVTDEEIDEIWLAVRDGTIVEIRR